MKSRVSKRRYEERECGLETFIHGEQRLTTHTCSAETCEILPGSVKAPPCCCVPGLLGSDGAKEANIQSVTILP